MARITMGQWITQALMDPHKDGPCTALVCMHKTAGGEVEVYGVKLAKGQQWDGEVLATLFREKAEHHVQDIPGSQRFYILAFYGRSEPQARLPFVVNNSAEMTNGETEAPTAEGRTAQAMRQSEVGFQFWAKMVHENVRMSMDMNESLSRENRELRNENRDAVSVIKDFILAQATNTHQFRLKELEYARQTEERKMLMRYGGAILNEVTGKEIIPQPIADTNLLELFFDKVGEDQIKQLSAVLPPELMGPLAARASTFFKAKMEAEQQASKAVEGRTDPVLEEGQS